MLENAHPSGVNGPEGQGIETKLFLAVLGKTSYYFASLGIWCLIFLFRGIRFLLAQKRQSDLTNVRGEGTV